MNRLHLRSLAQRTFKKEEGGKQKTITTFIASSDVEDRYQDIVSQESWRLGNFQKNPVVPINHCYTVEAVVGRATNLRVEEVEVEEGKKRKALLVDVEWDTESEEGRSVAGKVERGFINAVSVGFQSHRQTWRYKLPKDHLCYGVDGQLLEENELYEISVVAVPANPEAIAQRSAGAVDAKSIVEEVLLKLVTDDELWKKAEARRLAAKATTEPEPPKTEEKLYWLE